MLTWVMLQEHPLLAWPLFIFFLALAFYLYPEEADRTLSLPLLVIFPLITFPLLCTISACQIPSLFPYALSTLPVFTLLYSEPLTLLSVHDDVTSYPYCILGRWLTPCHPYHSLGLWLSLPFTLTLLPVSDSVSFRLAYLCTTTYSLVCAQVPYIYKPCVP
jgi:hypothetical protein